MRRGWFRRSTALEFRKDEPALLALDRSRARSGTMKLGEWAVT